MMGMFGNRKPQLPFGAQMPGVGSGTLPTAPVPQQPPSLGMGYQAPVEQPHGFNAPGGWADKLGGIGALLLSAGGSPAGPQMFDQVQQRRQQALLAQQALAARYAPQHIGDNIVHLDPQTGQYVTDWAAPAHDPAPTEIEKLALAAGLKPGTPEYTAAMQSALTNKTTAPPLVQHNPDGTLEVFPAGMIPRGGAPASSGPAPGTIDGGFRFKGGDPKNPANWEQVGGAGVRTPARFPGSVMDAVISQESGARPGVLGPQTAYGRAQGLSQMLPATAQQMAGKLGLPWRPDLMTGKDSTAAAYQRALGQAYLQQGMEATGNLPDALRYYHGGPSPKMWGPKTNAYAQNVLARLGRQ